LVVAVGPSGGAGIDSVFSHFVVKNQAIFMPTEKL
jgi:hypothetical protein